MQTKLGGILRLVICVIAAVTLSAPAWAGGEVFVVSARSNGDANYMSSTGDGSFSSSEILQISINSGITESPFYGNALGDFDNDGDYDYIVAVGKNKGSIYIFEKLEAGNQFAPPVTVASWSEGYNAMDIAVADFNGDGNQDFVMSYSLSFNSGLYLGDGSFGFTYSALANTAPLYSAGIDTADFNGDGIADFVVAPNSIEPIYVNLGKGDGTFTKSTFKTHGGDTVYGIAAADFNNDQMADIVTAGYDYLILYTGNGDGTFKWAARYEFEMDLTQIDNYDFDGDGNQDLVAANFGSAADGVAVLLGNGDGTFTLDDIYRGGTGGVLNAVSAPPYEPVSNIEPVAVLDSDSYEVTVGEVIEFNGSQSYDDDGEIVAYQWDFGDGDMVTEGGAVTETHVYSGVGQYYVTLTVTDDKGATASVQAEVHVAAVPVKVVFRPHTLKLNSREKWITATLRVPAGYNARQIDVASVQIMPDGKTAIAACTYTKYGFFERLFRNYLSRHRLTVKFKRQAVIDALAGVSGQTLLKVEGKIRRNGEWVDFSGSGIIQVSQEHTKRFQHGKKFGKK